jgi:hypothetical protein
MHAYIKHTHKDIAKTIVFIYSCYIYMYSDIDIFINSVKFKLIPKSLKKKKKKKKSTSKILTPFS